MIAQELEVSLHMAFVDARQQRHEFITVEHLLLSLLDKASGQVVAKVQCDASLSLRVCRWWLRGVPRVLLCGADERCSSLPV